MRILFILILSLTVNGYATKVDLDGIEYKLYKSDRPFVKEDAGKGFDHTYVSMNPVVEKRFIDDICDLSLTTDPFIPLQDNNPIKIFEVGAAKGYTALRLRGAYLQLANSLGDWENQPGSRLRPIIYYLNDIDPGMTQILRDLAKKCSTFNFQMLVKPGNATDALKDLEYRHSNGTFAAVVAFRVTHFMNPLEQIDFFTQTHHALDMGGKYYGLQAPFMLSTKASQFGRDVRKAIEYDTLFPSYFPNVNAMIATEVLTQAQSTGESHRSLLNKINLELGDENPALLKVKNLTVAHKFQEFLRAMQFRIILSKNIIVDHQSVQCPEVATIARKDKPFDANNKDLQSLRELTSSHIKFMEGQFNQLKRIDVSFLMEYLTQIFEDRTALSKRLKDEFENIEAIEL